MRFVQAFQQSLQGLETRLQFNKDAKVLIVATCEKHDELIPSFSRQFNDKFAFIPPEKADRELVIGWLLTHDEMLKRVDIELDVE